MANYTKQAGAALTIEADFTGIVYPGDSITSASATAYDVTAAQVVTGTFLSGSAAINGLIVSQGTVDGVAGHLYSVTIGANTAHGLVTRDVFVAVVGALPEPLDVVYAPTLWEELPTEAREYCRSAYWYDGELLWEDLLRAFGDTVADGYSPTDVLSRARDLDGLLSGNAAAYFAGHRAYRVRMGAYAMANGNAAAVDAINAYVGAFPPAPFGLQPLIL